MIKVVDSPREINSQMGGALVSTTRERMVGLDFSRAKAKRGRTRLPLGGRGETVVKRSKHLCGFVEVSEGGSVIFRRTNI